MAEQTERRVGWTQALCEPCFAAWALGRGELREPSRVVGDAEQDGDPCLVCGTPSLIYVRIDPKLAKTFRHAKEDT